MEKKIEKEGKGERKDFIWISLRISFWIMIVIWVLKLFFAYLIPVTDSIPDSLNIAIALIWAASGIFTFVVSIIHLTKYKSKAFAIVALVISSIYILLLLIGFIIGIIQGMNSLA